MSSDGEKRRRQALLLGYGYLGSAVGRELLRSGELDCLVIKRTPLPGSRVRVILADVYAADFEDGLIQQISRNLDYVFINLSPENYTVEAYRRAYPELMSKLLNALRLAKARPLILLTSSTSVYAVEDGSWVDESDSRLVTDAMQPAWQILQAEEALLASEFPALIARLGGIYGPDRQRFFQAILRGEIGASPDAAQRFSNRIHRDDAAAALVYLAEHYQAAWRGPVNVVDDEPSSQSALRRWVEGQCGQPLPVIEKSRPRQRSGNKRVSNRRLRTYGVQLRFPSFREGYAKSMECWRDSRKADR